MHDGDNPQRSFVRRISNQVILRVRKAQRPRCEVNTAMALVRKGDKRLDSRLDPIHHPISGVRAVFGYEFPNLVEVDFGFRVKIIPSH